MVHNLLYFHWCIHTTHNHANTYTYVQANAYMIHRALKTFKLMT